MIRIKNHLLWLGIVCCLMGCDKTTRSNQNIYNDKAVDEAVSEIESQIVEMDRKRQKRTKGFYERLLERFCQHHYNSCFDNVNYKQNSLYITYFDISENLKYVRINGYHSYRGWSSHNDVAFDATIEEKEDNYFEVTFRKDIEYAFDSRNGSESGTRTIYYDE